MQLPEAIQILGLNHFIMKEADIKLQIIRLLDSQTGEKLKELHQLILTTLKNEKKSEEPVSTLELGYIEMSKDKDREKEALAWAEGTLNAKPI